MDEYVCTMYEDYTIAHSYTVFALHTVAISNMNFQHITELNQRKHTQIEIKFPI